MNRRVSFLVLAVLVLGLAVVALGFERAQAQVVLPPGCCPGPMNGLWQIVDVGPAPTARRFVLLNTAVGYVYRLDNNSWVMMPRSEQPKQD